MPRVRPAKFVHVVYRTRRFEQMVRWYRTVFDAKVQHQNPALAFLTYDDEHHRFAFANLDVIQPGGGEADRRGIVGVDHVACTYASLDDLFSNYVQLKALGIEPYWCIHHGITVSMYYGDPDGNQMEFQVDSYASSDEANAFMCELQRQPDRRRVRSGSVARAQEGRHAAVGFPAARGARAGVAGARHGGPVSASWP